jgi:hypothetical protein
LDSQGFRAVAIGNIAGQVGQGDYAVAIGNMAGTSYQGARSIIFNATTTPLNSTLTDRFFIKPIRVDAGAATPGVLHWDSASGEVFQYSAKTFVIDHPIDSEKYLVHACVEGPEAGVYYRGEGQILEENTLVEISLPSYAKHIAKDFTVIAIPISDIDLDTFENNDMSNIKAPIIIASEVQDNEKFFVGGDRCKFNWLVIGKRLDIQVEPNKGDVIVKGDGPYTYLEKK